ncbi:MAG TPA: ABC transporter substrate-binding protein, partial [Dehalococcoidia bacterium]|nr:ABC transporter substrate-binding protein [Dehalococcoidia bacterium]
FLSQIPASFVYSRLLRFQPQSDPEHWNDSVPEGDAAESWEATPDALTWTFHLRQGMTWHDKPGVGGRPLDAEDVSISLERFRALSPNKANLDMIERVETPDPNTVVMTLSFAYAPFETIMANPNYLWITPKEANAGSVDLTQTMIGTGPFVFDSYEPSVAMRFSKNPTFYEQGIPYVDGVELFIIKDPSTMLSQFISGQLDTHAMTNPRDVEEAKRQISGLQSDEFLQTLLLFVYMQPYGDANEFYDPNSPFKDERVRRAVSMALDRDAMLQVLYQGKGRWNQVVPAGFTRFHLNPKDDAGEYGDAAQYYRHDPEAVRQLLAEAGFEDGIDADLHFTNNAYGDLFNQSAEVVNNMLNEAGIRTNLVAEDYGSQYISGTFLGNFQGIAYGPQSGFQEVDEYIFNMLHPSGLRNHSGVNDPELTRMIEAQRVELDAERRREIIHDIQRLVADKMYYVPTIVGSAEYGRQAYVRNFQFGSFYGIGTETYARVWLDR